MKHFLPKHVIAILLSLFVINLQAKRPDSPEIGTPNIQGPMPDSLNAPLELESPEIRRPLFSSVGVPLPSTTSRLRFRGYIKNESFFDSHQDAGAVQEQFFLYPKEPRPDSCGRDINDKGHFNMLAIESRIRGEVAGPKVFRANTFGVLEVDAWSQGVGLVIGHIRLRHAFMYFEWRDKAIIMGQYWHPVFVTDCFPDVIGFNGGCPFEFLAREAQIRLTKKFGSMTLLLAACSRGNSILDGPEALEQEVQGAYIRNGIMPNVNVQIHTTVYDHCFGLAVDATRCVPRLATPDDKLRVSESLMSYVTFAFASLNWPQFTLNLKVGYAQNGFGYTLISGYAIHCIDKYTKENVYTNTQCMTAWADMYYKHPVVQPGLFVGYTKNLGACRSIVIDPDMQTVFSGGQENIDYIFRFSPRVRWLKNPFILAVECDVTQAAFGTVTNTGRVKDAVPVNNFRAMLATYYVF